MAYVAVGEDGDAAIFVCKPKRMTYDPDDENGQKGVWTVPHMDEQRWCAISPHAAYKLTGRRLSWIDEPFEI